MKFRHLKALNERKKKFSSPNYDWQPAILILLNDNLGVSGPIMDGGGSPGPGIVGIDLCGIDTIDYRITSL